MCIRDSSWLERHEHPRLPGPAEHLEAEEALPHSRLRDTAEQGYAQRPRRAEPPRLTRDAESSLKGALPQPLQPSDPGRAGHGTEIADIHPVSYTHLRAHETRHDLVCRLLL